MSRDISYLDIIYLAVYIRVMAKKDIEQKRRGRPKLSDADKLARADVVRSERLSVALSSAEKQQVEELRSLLGLKSASSTFLHAIAHTLRDTRRKQLVEGWASKLQTMAVLTAQEFSQWKSEQQGGRSLRDFLREKERTAPQPMLCLELPVDSPDFAIRRLTYTGAGLYDSAIEDYCRGEQFRQEELAKALESNVVPYKDESGRIVSGWKPPYPAAGYRLFFSVGYAGREVDAREAIEGEAALFSYADSVSLAHPASFAHTPPEGRK